MVKVRLLVLSIVVVGFMSGCSSVEKKPSSAEDASNETKRLLHAAAERYRESGTAIPVNTGSLYYGEYSYVAPREIGEIFSRYEEAMPTLDRLRWVIEMGVEESMIADYFYGALASHPPIHGVKIEPIPDDRFGFVKISLN